MSATDDITWRVRPAEIGDIPALQEIEVDAGRRFRDIGMDSIADDDPFDDVVLGRHITDGTAWAAVDAEDRVLGYVLASMVDGEGHIDQVSVRFAAGRRGIGSALIREVCAWTEQRGIGSVTLTTFRDVSFNGPYYRTLGFVDIDDAQLGPELSAIRRNERETGIEVAPRVAMRRQLAARGTGRSGRDDE
ncbi:MAG: GNAT family N-acetyltransferase [Ilumatobacteraceae bacterium]